jgi:hypothetical protein
MNASIVEWIGWALAAALLSAYIMSAMRLRYALLGTGTRIMLLITSVASVIMAALISARMMGTADVLHLQVERVFESLGIPSLAVVFALALIGPYLIAMLDLHQRQVNVFIMLLIGLGMVAIIPFGGIVYLVVGLVWQPSSRFADFSMKINRADGSSPLQSQSK